MAMGMGAAPPARPGRGAGAGPDPASALELGVALSPCMAPGRGLLPRWHGWIPQWRTLANGFRSGGRSPENLPDPGAQPIPATATPVAGLPLMRHGGAAVAAAGIVQQSGEQPWPHPQGVGEGPPRRLDWCDAGMNLDRDSHKTELLGKPGRGQGVCPADAQSPLVSARPCCRLAGVAARSGRASSRCYRS